MHARFAALLIVIATSALAVPPPTGTVCTAVMVDTNGNVVGPTNLVLRWGVITGTPTTVGGYGITNALTDFLAFDPAGAASSATGGLGSAAWTPSTNYATHAQGDTADAALPRAGGVMTGSINMGSNGLFNITNLHAIVGYYSPFYSTNPPASIQLYYDGNKASRVRIAAGGRVTVNKFGRGDDDVATMRDLPSIPAVDNLTLTRKGNTDSVSAWIVNNGLSVWYAANLASMATSFIDGPGYYFGDEGGISSNLSSGYTFLNPGYDGVLPGLPSTNGFTVPDDWNGVYGGHWTYSPAISATMGVPTFAQDDGANGSWMWWCPGSWNGGSWGWIIQAGTSPGIWSYAFIYNAALSAGGTQFYLPYQCDAVGYYAIGPINPHDYPIEADMGTPSTVRTMTLVSLPMQLGFTASNALCTIMLQTTNTTLTTNQVAVGIVDMTGGTTNWAGPLIRQSQTDINNSLWTAACNFYGSTNVVELAIVSSNAADIIVKGMAAPCN